MYIWLGSGLQGSRFGVEIIGTHIIDLADGAVVPPLLPSFSAHRPLPRSPSRLASLHFRRQAAEHARLVWEFGGCTWCSAQAAISCVYDFRLELPYRWGLEAHASRENTLAGPLWKGCSEGRR